MSEATFRADVRLGWLVGDRPDHHGSLLAVRNSDGKTLEAHDFLTLLHRMAACDIVATYREAFAEDGE